MPLMIKKISRGEASEDLKAAVEKLNELRIANKVDEKLSQFGNAVFSFTGKMHDTRADIISLVQRLGGEALFNMNSHTTIVVNANPRGKVTKKLEKARRRRLPIITEKEFYELVKVVEQNS